MKLLRKFLCWIGWHNGYSGPIWWDGCSFHSLCRHCGSAVMQDSQGNWFEAARSSEQGGMMSDTVFFWLFWGMVTLAIIVSGGYGIWRFFSHDRH